MEHPLKQGDDLLHRLALHDILFFTEAHCLSALYDSLFFARTPFA
jgi:hypothetical protein